jgi:hypothetical protein
MHSAALTFSQTDESQFQRSTEDQSYGRRPFTEGDSNTVEPL